MKRLILLDDDEPFRNRLADALRNRGWEVIATADPSLAIRVASSGNCQGAIVDLRLPGQHGLDTVRQLRALSGSLSIVVLTGFGSIATALEAVRCGANDYLTKPCDPDTILAALVGQPLERSDDGTEVAVPSLDRVEWEHIQRVLGACHGNISRSARLLGIDRRSLQRKLSKYPPMR